MIESELVLDYLGLAAEAAEVEAAVEWAVHRRQGTAEIGGSLGTKETGDLIVARIRHRA